MNFNIFINSLCVFSSRRCRRHSVLICSELVPPSRSHLPHRRTESSRTSRLPQGPPVDPRFLSTLPHSSPGLALLLPAAMAAAVDAAAWIPSGSVQIFTHFIYMYVHTHQVFRRFSNVHMQRYIQICFAARAHNARHRSFRGVSKMSLGEKS